MDYSAAADPPLINFNSQPLINLPAHTQPRLLNRPPYEEMITRAIMALNEKEGSSRQKIAKYIENEFHVPQSSSELTQQLRKMKTYGQLVLVRHSYMLPNPGPPLQLQPLPLPSVGQPSLAPYAVYDGPKRRPGRPPKLQPTVASPSPTPTPSPSPPMGFAAFGPKQLGVPTTNLFGGLTHAAPAYQFGAGPVGNVSTMGLVTGPVNNAWTMLNGVPTTTLANGSVTNVPSTCPGSGSVSDVLITDPVSGSLNNVHATSGHMTVSNALFTSPVGSVSNVSSISPVDSVIVGTGHESSAAEPIVVSAAKDSIVAPNNDGHLLVVSAGPDSGAQDNDGPSTVLGKRGRGRPPKIDGGPKKVWGYVRKKGRRGRPKQIAISTISLRPRGRPRKNVVGATVAVDRANGGGGGVLPVANIPWEPRGNSLGRPNKDVPDTASLTSEIYLMAYHGLKARVEHYQTRIKSVVSIVKPYLNETAVIALGALQDLEDLASMDVLSVPINGQNAVNVQGAPGNDLNAPVNVKDVATENIHSLPSTGEDAQLTFQGTMYDSMSKVCAPAP